MEATYARVEAASVPVEAVSSRRSLTIGLALLTGICVAGFWNASVADGFGRDVIAGNTIGGATGKAAEFSTLGAGFGFLFAVVAGLAATFTACNCVAFAMIPGMVCARDAGSVTWWRPRGVLRPWVRSNGSGGACGASACSRRSSRT